MERKLIITLKTGIRVSQKHEYAEAIYCDAVYSFEGEPNVLYYEKDKDTFIIPIHNILGTYPNPKFNTDGTAAN
jgi:hypothetical protein